MHSSRAGFPTCCISDFPIGRVSQQPSASGLGNPRDQAEIQAAILDALKPRPNAVAGTVHKDDPLDHFSTTRFEQRVHAILDCIAG